MGLWKIGKLFQSLRNGHEFFALVQRTIKWVFIMSWPRTIFCSYCYNNFNAALRSNSVSLCVTALSDFFPMNTEVISQGVNWVQYKGAFHLIFRVSVDMYGQDRGRVRWGHPSRWSTYYWLTVTRRVKENKIW